MRNNKPEIAPEEIRAIREYLGLSQVEAGEFIGGGPRAFTKYEAGVVKPSAAVINTLRRLEADPTAVTALEGRASRPIRSGPTSPFEVSGEHIAALTERTLPLLLRLLLSTEAKANDLPGSPHPRSKQHLCYGRRGRRTDHMEARPGPHTFPAIQAQPVPVESRRDSASPRRPRTS